MPMYDWSVHFKDKTVKTTLKGITQMHHFRFPATHPGTVKNTNKGVEREIKLAFWNPFPNDLPNEIVPPGLPFERQWYLYERLRPEYCRLLKN